MAATLALAALAAAATACGSDASAPDGGATELSSLVVLDPPGESVGLPFHGVETLRVQYRNPSERPVTMSPVSFELITSTSEATGGSTVSAAQAFTDLDGIASVDLVAGAERVNFRVQATAMNAPPALFYITVSEEGFAALIATPEHAGFRAPGDLGAVEVHLYRAADLRCADLDIDAAPESVFPPRVLRGFGDDAAYHNVGAREPYTLIAWGSVEPQGPRLAAGCVELEASNVRAGDEIRFPLPVADRMPALPMSMAIASRFDATPLAAAVAAAGPDMWNALDCPLGRAQLLLDCALDAQAPDGALDCAVNGTVALVAEVQARRGPQDASGCRPGQVSGGGASIDAVVEGRLGPPWPAGQPLAALLAARRAPLLTFDLASHLEAGSAGSLGHRLDRIAVSSGDASAELDLVASDRPVVRQTAAMSIDPVGGRLSIGRHSFTVDYGRFARDAFAELGLVPVGLGSEGDTLGTALYQSVALGGQVGCTAFSQVVCGDIGRPSTCLETACGAARVQLDVLLDAWWRVLDGPDYDFALTGSAPLADDDGDLVLDLPGQKGADQGGTWQGEVDLAAGDPAAVAGTFTDASSAR